MCRRFICSLTTATGVTGGDRADHYLADAHSRQYRCCFLSIQPLPSHRSMTRNQACNSAPLHIQVTLVESNDSRTVFARGFWLTPVLISRFHRNNTALLRQL